MMPDSHRRRPESGSCIGQRSSGETLAENSAPAAVISSSKNLLESLFRIVLDRSQIDYAAREDIPQLYRKTRTWPPAPPPAPRQHATSHSASTVTGR